MVWQASGSCTTNLRGDRKLSNANWKNRTLFHGDNLKILRAMNSESVDLIATDPPFNKGRDFHATPDSLASGASFQDRWSWREDVDQEWVDQITDDFPKIMYVIQGSRNSYGDDMGAFLCFMAVRLLEMRRLLKSTGSIYLHCDPTASHYLKELMDAIFGHKNFINEIIWHYQTGGASKSWYSKKHDNILFYTMSKKYVFRPHTVQMPRTEKALKRALNPKGARISVDNTEKLPMDVWTDIQALNPVAKERTGYPTQKPLALYERIIKASSNKGDIVLDPFAGCATTCVAAERLGRQWVGIDIWDKAEEVVIDRLEQEGLIAPKYSRKTASTAERFLFTDDMYFMSTLPNRTDTGEEAVPFLKPKLKVDEPKGQKMSRATMVEFLLDQMGCKCQGCDRVFDDPRYLELDHNTPRSDGGLNHISNRILLCSPCNKVKSNQLTLSGLRRSNKKNGWMTK